MSPARALEVLRRRAAARRTQDGYALMIALGVIALTFLTIIALLGLALTTSRVTTVQREANTRNRAADGALEAALVAVADGVDEPCESVPTGSQLSFDAGGDPVDVTVECVTGTGADLVDDPDADFGGDDVFVADRSQGALRHGEGPPLRFDADVSVRGGATSNATGAGPAYRMLGQYRQGLAGVGVANQASTDCGPLVTADGPQRVADRNDTPECGVVQPDGTPLLDAPLPRDQLRSPLRTSVNITSATCATDFTPGYYDPAAVRKLNQLFRDCAGATFVFAPGATPVDSVYQFDANDPDAGADRSALVLDNPGVTVVFGVAASGGAGAPLCDRSASGSSVELTGRTALRHRAGRLAVCPANGLAAVTQIPNAALAPVVTVTSSQFTPTAAVTSPGTPAYGTFPQTCLFNNPAGACRTRNVQFTTTNLPDTTIEQLDLRFNSVETPKTQPQDRNVLVQVTNVRAPGSNVTCAYSALGRTPGLGTAIDLGACAPSLVGKPASVLEGARFSVTVRVGTATAVVLGPQVRLGIWDLRLQVNPEQAQGSAATVTGWGGDPSGALVYADTLVTPFTAATGAVPADALKYGSWAVPNSTRTASVTDLQLVDADVRDRNVELSSLDLVLASQQPTVAVEAYPTASAVSDAGDGSKLAVQLTRAGTPVCSFDLAGYGRSSRPVRIDLFDQPGCAAALLRSGDLTGLDVSFTYTLGCARFTPALNPNGTPQPVFDQAGNCLTVRVPDLGFVGLEATTDVVTVPPPASELTVDADGSGGPLAAATIFGDVLLGGSDLNLRWSGGAPGAGQSLSSPLVVGNLQVGRLKSAVDAGASVGTVCCYLPNPRQGRLQAVIDGTPWAETLVEVDSIDGTATVPREVRILDWRFCGASACGPRRPQSP